MSEFDERFIKKCKKEKIVRKDMPRISVLLR